ncbi:tetratricopeptide repeat protein [Amycolatopsis sp. NPDC051758]|uniref:tetratricopeptide repeat protein n=1 Tax=Amycolatopsis sp. NPDC051758 TaxID=3363935 RepID=UPI0037BA7950
MPPPLDHHDNAALVGRSHEVREFSQFISGNDRVLVLWGAPGSGKSTLVRDLRTRCAAPTGSIDLEEIVSADPPSRNFTHDIARRVLDEFAIQFVGDEGRKTKGYRSAAATADRTALGTQPPIFISQHAIDGTIIDSPITVLTAGPHHLEAESARTAQRRLLTRALIDDLARTRIHDFVLFVDTTERLHFLDQHSPGRDHGTEGSGAGHWLTHDVLTGLLRALPRLKVVLAGWHDIQLPAAIPAMHLEVRPWSQDSTCEYAVSRGVRDHTFHEGAHRICGGNPTWTGFLLDSCLPTGDSSSGRLHFPATADSARWLMDAFLERLSPIMREVVITASIMRSVNKEAIVALAEDDNWPRDWFEILCRFSFFAVSDVASTGRRIHPIVRRALLTHLFDTEPARHARMHRRAAEHRRQQGDYTEETYHRFASGDKERLHEWRQSVANARRNGKLDDALRMVELATAPEQQQVLRHRAPEIVIGAELESSAIALDQGKLAEASARAGIARQLADENDDTRALGEAVHRLADVLLRKNDLPHAEALFRECVDLCTLSGDSSTLADVRAHLAAVALRRRDWEAAVARLEELVREQGSTPDRPDHLAGNLISLACARAKQGDTHASSDLLAQAAQVRGATGTPVQDARFAQWMGQVFWAQGDLASAETHLCRAVEGYSAADRHNDAADALHTIGDMFLGHREYSKAEKYLFKALDAYSTQAMPVDRADVLRDLSTVAHAASDYSRADELISEALVIFEAEDHQNGIARTLLSRANVERDRGDDAAARKTYTRALALARQVDNRFVICESLQGLGRLDRDAGNLDEAEEKLNLALTYAEDGLPKVNSYFILATVYRMMHDPARAHLLLQQTLDLARAADDQRGIANVFYEQGLLASQQGDTNTAVQKFSSAQKVYRSIDDGNGLLLAADQLVRLAIDHGKTDIAKGLARRALAEHDGASHPASLASLYARLATIELDRKEQLLTKAESLYQKAGNDAGVAYSLYHLGVAHRAGKRLDDARELLTRAAGIAGESLLPHVLNELGRVEIDAGRPLKARPWLAQARLEDDAVQKADAVLQLAMTYRADKQHYFALLAEAIELAAEPEVRIVRARALLERGEGHAAIGRLEAAENDLTDALTIFDQLDDPAGAARSLGLLGRMFRDRGMTDIAAQMLDDSLSMYQRARDEAGAAWVTSLLHHLRS